MDLKSDSRTITFFGQNAAAIVATPSAILLDVVLDRARVGGDAALDLVAQFGGLAVELEQRLRVDADVAVDDELEPGEPDALVGQPLERERELRVADVHHDLGRAIRHAVERRLDHLDLERALVDVAGVALGTRDGDRRAFRQHRRRVAAPHDRRDAELAGDDRRVAGAPATVGDDRRGPLHHGLPVRVGHVGDEHVACLDLVHLGGGADQAHRADADLLADRATAREHRCRPLQPIAARRLGAAFLRLHGLGTRLEHVQLPVESVATPLDVHRAAVVPLDRHRAATERVGLLVGDGEAQALGLRNLDGGRRAAGRLRIGEDHPDRLAADGLAQDRRTSLGEVALVDVELIGVDRALHDGLAKAVRRSDEHDLVEARLRVQGEHHAGRAEVAAHHPLHAGGEGNVGMREALVHSIGDRAVVVEARKYLLYCVKNVIQSLDI